MTLEQINSLPQAGFVDALGWIFEHSAWVAERAWDKRPFGDLDGLHRAMQDVVEGASHEEQLALLRAHPDLASRLKLSAASQAEQTASSFTSLEAPELEWWQTQNAAYHRKFGFPFIYAVKGSPAHDVATALEIRLGNSPEEEFHEALYQVYRIAYFRLTDRIIRS